MKFRVPKKELLEEFMTFKNSVLNFKEITHSEKQWNLAD